MTLSRSKWCFIFNWRPFVKNISTHFSGIKACLYLETKTGLSQCEICSPSQFTTLTHNIAKAIFEYSIYAYKYRIKWIMMKNDWLVDTIIFYSDALKQSVLPLREAIAY